MSANGSTRLERHEILRKQSTLARTSLPTPAVHRNETALWLFQGHVEICFSARGIRVSKKPGLDLRDYSVLRLSDRGIAPYCFSDINLLISGGTHDID